ncbi:MAG TPA: hypothetical protein VGK87_08485 [Anaerolineae bacterium]|jgi:hypothetical protein
MLNSKIIVISVAVLGLGGIGVAAASGAGRAPDATSAQHTASTTSNNSSENSYNVVPSVFITGANESDLHLNASDIVESSDFTDTIASTEPITNPNRPATAIGLKFGVNVTDVVQLHNSGWGFGEIYQLYALAKMSNKTPAQIQAMRDSGMGWGQIVKALGLKHGNHGNNLGSTMSNRGGHGKDQQP